MRRFTLLSILLWTVPAVAQNAPDLRGIYIYTNDVSQITNATANALNASLTIPGVDGVAVVIGWNAIEPAMGQYSWATLDQWIGKAVAANRKIDLVVPAGASTPAWLFQASPMGAGAQPLNFTITPHDGATTDCQAETIAAPWDPAFLTQFSAMLAALSAHLKSAGTYNAVTFVRLTGINRTTEEFRLPAETPQSTGLACVTDAIATWESAGYKPSLVLQGWKSVLNAFGQSFPDKPFALSIIVSNAFPAISESGTTITGTPPDPNLPLLTAASQMFPGRLTIEYDFLMTGEAASSVLVQYGQTFGTPIAFQTNEYLGGQGAACSEPVSNPTLCSPTTYLQLLEEGIYPLGQSNALRAEYIEVFHDNAAAFPAVIQQAHALLAPPVVSLVANAEGQNPVIAPNTWVNVKGEALSPAGDTRIWTAADFVNGQLPTQLDGVSVSVNGKPAYVYYISPTQVNILTTTDALPASVQVQVNNNGAMSGLATAQAKTISPSFFVFDATHVAAVHASGGLIGPATLYPGQSTPAKPGEIVMLYANGFGTAQGALSPLPVVTIGGVPATVDYAGQVASGEFQFNVTIPANAPNGDDALVATFGGATTQSGVVLTVQQ